MHSQGLFTATLSEFLEDCAALLAASAFIFGGSMFLVGAF